MIKHFPPLGLCAASILVLPLVPGRAAAQSEEAASPHIPIIFIMTDQQRADALGCASDGQIITPHMDALAAAGHRFTSAYTAAPSSTPARAGLLTGQAPWHHGMLGYGRVAEHYPAELPELLRRMGYHTMGIGKMHWYPQTSTHGFEVTLTDESGRVESPYYMSDYRKWFHNRAFGLNPDSIHLGWNAHGARCYPLPEELHPTVWTADRAVEAIRGYHSDRPLFLKVSFARPHSPYDPPQRWYDRYAERDVPHPVVGEWVGRVPIDTLPERHPDAPNGNFGEDYVLRSRRHYYASLSFVDEQVGRIIAALKETGLYDRALICFTSDHGDMLGDHHMWRKTYAYEGSAAIPFIVKMPKGMEGGLPAGATIDAPVELRDFLPTFLDLNGQAAPESVDGRSLLPLLRGERTDWREFIDIEHNTCYRADNYWCALTDGHTKYVWFFRSGREQLFDLDRDPGELHDLSGERRSRKQLTYMRRAMVEHLRERGEEWVQNDTLVVRKHDMLYSPHYPAPRGTEKVRR